jgi:HAD superfamily hydrolase (TIGR01509 family)
VATAVLDIDGTLVDTNYHHAVAWFRAFRQHGFVLPLWRIHRHIGMGSDQLFAALAGEGFDSRQGDEVRAAEKVLYAELIGEVQPLTGARALMEDLKGSGHTVILASSAKTEELEHYLTLLDARSLADDWTDSGDVARTKPSPDLVLAALEKAAAAPKDAVLIGDSTWDCRAAKTARVKSIGVLTGGFSEGELLDAGASRVFTSVEELRSRLEETVLRV